MVEYKYKNFPQSKNERTNNMRIKTKITALAIAMACTFGTCAAAAPKEPDLLPFLNTDAAAVVAMIDSIEIADLTTEKQIEEAFLAYCDLEDSAKAEVENYEKLIEMREALAKLYNPEAENKPGGKRMNRSEIIIGTYYYGKESYWSDKHFQEIRDCNIDMLLCVPYNTTLLDYCAKYDIGAVLNVISIPWGKPIPFGTYDAYAENFVDHPAIYGFDIVDEPSSIYFEDLEKLRAEAEKSFPDKFLYMNLFPSEQPVTSYGYENGSGKDFYDYAKDFSEKINLDFISYDLYQYGENQREKGGTASGFLAMGVTSAIARETGKEYWFVPQVSADLIDDELTTGQLRYQAFTAMTFGAKAINWACYAGGWWHENEQVVDGEGNRTILYDRLKTVNTEIKYLSPIYMRYSNMDTAFTAAYDYEGQYQMDDMFTRHFDNDLDQNTIKDLTATNHSTLITGYFEKNIGNGTAFMFTNASNDYDSKARPGGNIRDWQDVKVQFKLVDTKSEVIAYYKNTAHKLSPDKNGVYSLSVPNGEGIFVTVDPISE